MSDITDSYGFHFLGDVENPPIQLISTGTEQRNKKEYYFDNSTRPDCYLFQYTLSGSGTVVLGSEPHEVTAGQAFFLKLPGSEKYYFHEQKNCAPWHFVYIMFRGSGVTEYFDRIVAKKGTIITIPENASCIRYLTELYHNAAGGYLTDPYSASSMTYGFLCSLAHFTLANKETYPKNVASAMLIMEKEFATLIGIAEIADRLHISPHHLSRQFVKETGNTPVTFLIKMRLQHAAELLHNTDFPVEEIALKSGFSCGNYFGKVFKKYLKLSPGEFRSQKDSIHYTKVRL